jgi:hypothetical protein
MCSDSAARRKPPWSAMAMKACHAEGVDLHARNASINEINSFYWQQPDRHLQLNVERPWHPFACGVICLAFNLTAGIAGLLLDIFFVRSKMTRQRVVATEAATQAFSHLVKVAYFGGVVAMGADEVTPLLAATMVVLAFVGTSMSRSMLDRITDASFRQWTRWTVMTLGVMYLVGGIRLVLG